jgi:transcriptional regulator with XRE-family HTH domain
VSTYGQRLRQARELRELTQTTLAELSGVKQQVISNLERDGQEATSFTLELARALRVNPFWLDDGEGDMIGVYPHDPSTREVLKAMEQMPDYERRRVVRMLQALTEEAPEDKAKRDGGR